MKRNRMVTMWGREEAVLHGCEVYDAQTADEHLEMLRQLEIDGHVSGRLTGRRRAWPPNEAIMVAAMIDWDRVRSALNRLAQLRKRKSEVSR